MYMSEDTEVIIQENGHPRLMTLDHLYNYHSNADRYIYTNKGFRLLEELFQTGGRHIYNITTEYGHEISIANIGSLIDVGFDAIHINGLHTGVNILINGYVDQDGLNLPWVKDLLMDVIHLGCDQYVIDSVRYISYAGYEQTYSVCMGGDVYYILANGFLVPTMNLKIRDLYNLNILTV